MRRMLRHDRPALEGVFIQYDRVSGAKNDFLYTIREIGKWANMFPFLEVFDLSFKVNEQQVDWMFGYHNYPIWTNDLDGSKKGISWTKTRTQDFTRIIP